MSYVIFFIVSLIIPMAAMAVCPLCTFAVGAGIGLAQYFGVDDTITGFWIGGLMVSMVWWTNIWLEKNNIIFYGRNIVVAVVYYSFAIIPLYFWGIMGHALNKYYGIDKILLGIVIGSIVFFVGVVSYEYLKNNNQGKAYFSFQKIVMPVAPLVILSIIFCYLTK